MREQLIFIEILSILSRDIIELSIPFEWRRREHICISTIASISS
jgi:hypothetical protein